MAPRLTFAFSNRQEIAIACSRPTHGHGFTKTRCPAVLSVENIWRSHVHT